MAFADPDPSSKQLHVIVLRPYLLGSAQNKFYTHLP